VQEEGRAPAERGYRSNLRSQHCDAPGSRLASGNAPERHRMIKTGVHALAGLSAVQEGRRKLVGPEEVSAAGWLGGRDRVVGLVLRGGQWAGQFDGLAHTEVL